MLYKGKSFGIAEIKPFASVLKEATTAGEKAGFDLFANGKKITIEELQWELVSHAKYFKYTDGTYKFTANGKSKNLVDIIAPREFEYEYEKENGKYNRDENGKMVIKTDENGKKIVAKNKIKGIGNYIIRNYLDSSLTTLDFVDPNQNN